MNKQVFELCNQTKDLIELKDELIKFSMERIDEEEKELIWAIAYDYLDQEIMRNLKDIKHIERIECRSILK